MPFLIKGEGSYEPAPQGPAAAVCVDVVNLGTVETRFGAKHKLDIVWSIDKRMKAKDRNSLGRPYLVQQRYTVSLHEKSTLRQHLEAWFGKKMSDKTVKEGFDLEKLIGRGAYLSIRHNESDGKVYANVVAVMPLPEGMPKPIPDPEYVRRQDRPPKDGRTQKSGQEKWEEEPPPPPDEDAPSDEQPETDSVFD